MTYFLNANWKYERVATRCVCCGEQNLLRSPAILMPFVAHRVFGWRPVQIDATWGLNTISNGYAYSICNSLYCNDCGLLFLDIRFSDDELSRLYQDYRGAEYVALREHYEPGYSLRNEELNQTVSYVGEVERFVAPYLVGKPRVLDWGGGTGSNSPFRGKSEFLHVFDISQKELVIGASKVSEEESLLWKYDLVVCSQVLEHVAYPFDVLLLIRERMESDTILYLEVPYEYLMKSDDANKVELKKHWHEHVNFFSFESIHRLMISCGFSIIEMKSLAVNIGGRDVEVIQVVARKNVL